jgi:hypothetical protein
MTESHVSDLARPVSDNDLLHARALFPELDFVAFHTEQLPKRISRYGHLVVEDLRGGAPIGFTLPDGPAYTYTPSAEGIRVDEGEAGAEALCELGAADFSDLVHELHTVSGLVIGHKVHVRQGGHADLERWQPALRALFSGRPIWTPEAAADLVDAAGQPLDLTRSFTLDDSDADLCAFLRSAGFLHVKRAFAPEEIAALGAQLEGVRAALEPGAGDCWWSTNAAGEQVVTRINYLDRWSDAFSETGLDARVQRLGRLEDDEAGKPVIALETEPGDVTVHYGDIFHTTPPPTSPDAGRRVLYYKFAPPRTFQTIPPGGHYNDILFKPDSAGRVATRSATWEDDDTQAAFQERTFQENENEEG